MHKTTKLVLLVSLLIGLVDGHARAAPSTVDIGLFRPPATSEGLLGVDSAFTAGHLKVAGSLFFDYAHEPLVLRTSSGSMELAVIRHQVGLQAAVSASFFSRLELGVIMPAVLYQTGDPFLDGTRPSKAAAGDLRIEAKVHFGSVSLGHGRAVGFGLTLGLGTPTGGDDSLAGNDGVTFWPRFMASFLVRPVEVLIEIGAVIRSDRTLVNIDIGQQLRFGFAARVAVYRGLGLTATIAGTSVLDGTRGEAGTPLEFLTGPDYRFGRVPLDLVLAAGRGITDAFGSPNARFVLALRYQPRVLVDRDGDGVGDLDDLCPRVRGPKANQGCPDTDRDRDGLIDRLDRCPDAAGPKENAGCPWPDRDGDGVVDPEDRCPDQAGPVENQGCPDTDRDGDHVVDRLDRCPDRPGPVDNQGCPWPDRDGDGVPDKDDRCPDEKGLPTNHGCPVLDADGDGIPDQSDRCPKEKENFNGFEDDDGCPDRGPELAVLTDTKIEIRREIFFETAKATIKPASFQLLAAVAKILNLHPEIEKVRIEGHTDIRGGRDYNLRLSQSRAEAVRKHLITILGVDESRLSAQGFGPDQPIADNRTDAGRARNRRSAFVIETKAGQPAQ